jgi:5'-nucleotidase
VFGTRQSRQFRDSSPSRRERFDDMVSNIKRSLRRGASVRPDRTDAAGVNAVVRIRLLTVNDFHGALTTTGVVDGRPAGGAAYLAAYLARDRARHPQTSLLVHAGDMVGLSPPLSGLLQDEPTGAVLNKLGFAAGVVGNHEFDEGVDELVRLVDGGNHPATIWTTGSFPGFNFPCLGANVISERTGHPLLPAARVLTVAGVRIGVIGVVGTEAARNLGTSASGVRFADEASSVKRHIAELRERRVAAIVVLAHLGATGPGGAGGRRGRLPEFAAALDADVDLIVAGHTHQPAVVTFGNVLTVQAHPHGLSYGAVDLWIDLRSNRVVERGAEIVPTFHDGIEPDRITTALIESFERLAAPLAEPTVTVGATPFVREPAPPDAPLLGPVIADAYRSAAGAEIGLVHPAELHADLPAGPLSRADLYKVLPGGHDLVAARMSGAQLLRLLDDRSRPVRAPRPYCSGARPEFVLDRAQGQRLAGLRLADGEKLDPGGFYTVAGAAPVLGTVRSTEIRAMGKALAAAESYLRDTRRDTNSASSEEIAAS